MKKNLLNTSLLLGACAVMLAACQGGPLGSAGSGATSTLPDATSTANSVAEYKVALARRISEVSSNKVSAGRPQAMLHSVIVIKFSVDGEGRLLSSAIERTNHIRANEKTAMETLKAAAPFPKPASNLLRRGRVELYESWLFNSDGRFQLRSIAEAQMDH